MFGGGRQRGEGGEDGDIFPELYEIAVSVIAHAVTAPELAHTIGDVMLLFERSFLRQIVIGDGHLGIRFLNPFENLLDGLVSGEGKCAEQTLRLGMWSSPHGQVKMPLGPDVRESDGWLLGAKLDHTRRTTMVYD